MRQVIVLLFVALTFISCNKEMEKPNDLIPRTEMKSLLKDIYIYRQVKNIDVKKVEHSAKVDLAILEKHNVSLEQFKSSFKYYLIKGAAYDDMLNEIKTELEAELPKDTAVNKKAELEKTNKTLQPLKDKK